MVPRSCSPRYILPFALLACSAEAPRSIVVPPSPVPIASSSPALATTTAPVVPPKKSDRFAVATENTDAANAAVAAFRAGGNVFDAAVAGVFMAGVTQPASTGIGGDGFAVVWDAHAKRATVIDFRARAPVSLHALSHLGKTPSRKQRGVMVGVPGLVAGMFALHDKRGLLAWADLVNPAADAAQKGFAVSPYMAQAFAWLREDPDDARLMERWGLDPAVADHAGDIATNKPLAATLRAIATGGPDALYQGDIAASIVSAVEKAGGTMAPTDLATYVPFQRDALEVHWEGLDVFTAPSPSSGGFVVAEMLGLFKKDDLGKLGFDSAEYVHTLSEGLRLAQDDRALAVGDPDFTKMTPDEFLDPARLRDKRSAFRSSTTTLPKQPSVRSGGTFHLVAIDADGNVVSVTSTVTSLFGSKIIPDDRGFVLDDALVDFTMDEYGLRLTNRGPNFPRGGARPASSMAPVIAVKDGEVLFALGASGGYRIPGGVTEVLFAHAAFGRPIVEAVGAPRFGTSPSGTLLLDGGLASLAKDLGTRGEIIESRPSDFSAVSAIAVRREGGIVTLEAAGDPRKHGAAVVVGAEP